MAGSRISPENNALLAEVARLRDQLLVSGGQALLHAQYPNDFEYYLCAFELTDFNDTTIEYFIFPVNPDNISINNQSITNVQKSQAGVTSLSNATFVPIDIQISGSFGRKLRLITRTEKVSLPTSLSSVVSEVNKIVKTGYGMVKLLERMFDKSITIDGDTSYRLYFYNYAFNAHYLVEGMLFNASIDKNENMIWKYNMVFKAIAPAESINGKFDRKASLKKGFWNKAKNKILNFTMTAKNDFSLVFNNG